jgi:hypothetical protein
MSTKRKPAVGGLKPNRLKARQDVASALHNCLTHTHTDRDDAAKELDVAKRTLAGWLRRETAITVEIILAAPRLAKAFRRELCSEHHEPLAYVAKKRRAK